MVPEIWEPNLTVVFAGAVVSDLSDTLGFYHVHRRDRFWELLVLGEITPKPILTAAERKALAEGQKDGSLSEPVRAMFTLKKTSHLLQQGIGLTDVNRRVIALDEKDKAGWPAEEDIHAFIAKAEKLTPQILAFVTRAEVFVGSFKHVFPEAAETFGVQPFTIGNSEVWFMGPTSAMLRGDSLGAQEDAFISLGERFNSLRDQKG